MKKHSVAYLEKGWSLLAWWHHVICPQGKKDNKDIKTFILRSLRIFRSFVKEHACSIPFSLPTTWSIYISNYSNSKCHCLEFYTMDPFVFIIHNSLILALLTDWSNCFLYKAKKVIRAGSLSCCAWYYRIRLVNVG